MDIERVGDTISSLVKTLGLKTSLKDYAVGMDQMEGVVKLGTGGQEKGTVLGSGYSPG